uniref:Non-lysosomal glucosylceramidase n=1 Tax=Araucaria cunninghamii TaxID=56994 RepID=A0A0D6QSI8_ARACU
MVSGTLFHSRRHSWPPDEYVNKPTLQLLESDHGAPPQQAWRRRLNSHANILKEFSVTFMEAMKMVRLGFRLWTYVKEERSQGRKAPIDPFTRERCKPSASQGVPLGGMGSGSICRGFRGEFRHWQMIPGMCEAPPVLVNQFSIFVSRDEGRKKYASVLAPGCPEELSKGDDTGISTWDWVLDGQHSTYHALFPRAWTVYDGEPDPELKISCRQISPFIPHNYRESSLPTCAFAYTLVNTGKETANVSLLFTWANSIGGTSHLSGGHVNRPFRSDDGVCGMLLHHKTAKGYPPVTFAIASCQTENVHVTVLPCFGLSGKSYTSAKDMWATMKQEGQFDNENWNAGCSFPSLSGEELCAAVSASAVVEPHGTCSIVFALAWASPKVKFVKGSTYCRRYTQFYGTSEDAAINLVHDALMDYRRWETEIENWQNPILKNEKLPEWYRFTLFNELYYLVAGGTIWTDGRPPVEQEKPNTLASKKKSRKKENKSEVKECKAEVKENKTAVTVTLSAQNGELNHLEGFQRLNGSDGATGIESKFLREQKCEDGEIVTEENSASAEENVGGFLYLEGVEYMMWCTYDVHFYASFALLDLFPKIELNIQREFAKAVLVEDNTKVKFLAEGNWGIRKVKGAVPHDLGLHDPWIEINAYNIHDTSQWKDLNTKFVLQVYRDLVATDDMSFGKEVWPAVCAAMEYMQQFDRDVDGLIENDGFPDQTYDTWTVHGVSAYCGGLWIAALQAATAMAEKLGHKETAEKYRLQFQKAKVAYEKKLWNGSYFNYDSGTSSNSNSIQADQLAGQWYAWASGLPSLFDPEKIQNALQKIYDFNVMKIGGGRMGAVNGMHPTGKVDETCMQSREIWTGVTYAVAAVMLHAEMSHQAFSTAEGIFQAGWSEDGFGYWFQTPEAWTTDGHYRSLIYMRPLAIWAMQWALNPPKAVLEAPRINMMERECVSQFQTRFAGALKHVPKPRFCGCSWNCNF